MELHYEHMEMCLCTSRSIPALQIPGVRTALVAVTPKTEIAFPRRRLWGPSFRKRDALANRCRIWVLNSQQTARENPLKRILPWLS